MGEIIIHNATREWIECIDVIDKNGLTVAAEQSISIPKDYSSTVFIGDTNQKLTIFIGKDYSKDE